MEQQGKAVKKEMRPQEKFTNQDLGSSAAQIARILQVNFEWKNLNPYNVLQLDIDANEEDVKTRYKKLSTLVHPDKNLGVDNAKDAFDEVKKAYNLLKDEEKVRPPLVLADYASLFILTRLPPANVHQGPRGERQAEGQRGVQEVGQDGERGSHNG